MAGSISTLRDCFAEIEDPRRTYLVEHQLLDIIMLTILASICGADTWVEIEAYGKAKEEWLKNFLALPNGIPSHDTLARVFARLDPEALQASFQSWIQAVSEVLAEVIAIDGKALRHAYDQGGERGMIYMVSAWATHSHLVLGQRQVEAKSNEIKAVPKLLELLCLKNCIVTLDAMGTQKAIAQQIVEQGGDYVLALKENHPNLCEDVRQLFDWARRQQFQDIDHNFHQTVEKGHGRLENRRYWTLGNTEYLLGADEWLGLTAVGLVESERRLGDKTTIEQRYYLLSFAATAEQFAASVRSHWGIENSLHWRLDVAFREDDSRARTGHSPQNLALVRHLALNLLTHETSLKSGLHAKRLRAGWDNAYLLKVLSSL